MGYRILLLSLAVSASLQIAAGQGLSPATPSKEYVRFGGQTVAVEVAGCIELTSAVQELPANTESGTITVGPA